MESRCTKNHHRTTTHAKVIRDTPETPLSWHRVVQVVPIFRRVVRKYDSRDIGRTTLKLSGNVRLTTRLQEHQELSPYEDARGSCPRDASSEVAPTSRRGRAIFHEAVRKDDFVDNAPTTLKISGSVKLITIVADHQTASLYDNVRGSYDQYPVTACTTRVTLSNQPWTPRPS